MPDGQWQPCTLVKFLDDAGNLLTWYASSDQDCIVGTVVTFNGTVKASKEYQGIKCTACSQDNDETVSRFVGMSLYKKGRITP